MINKIIRILLLASIFFNTYALSPQATSYSAHNLSSNLITTESQTNKQPITARCSGWSSWFKGFCFRLHQIWEQGDNDLYFSGYAWHNRYTYSQEKINRYNELAWGGGLGKSFYDEKGNWHALSAIAFLDSHAKLEPAVGYSYQKIAHFNENTRFGVGYSIFLTSRADIVYYYPIPGALPWISFSYRRLTLLAAYIPGGHNNGNVLFIIGKWQFDKVKK